MKKTMKRFIKKIILLILLLTIFIPFLPLPSINASESESSKWFNSGEFRETTYYRTLSKWEKTFRYINNIDITSKVIDNTLHNTLHPSYDEEYKDYVFTPSLNTKVDYKVTVEKKGLYYLYLDYKYDLLFNSSPSIDVLINNEVEYNELENINLPVLFNTSKRDEATKYNRFGDELLPFTNPINKWYYANIKDAFNSDTNDFCVLLNEGENTISITSNVDSLILGSLFVKSKSNTISYIDYIDTYSKYQSNPKTLIVEAEDYNYKNDIEVKASYYKSYIMTPNSYKSQVLNMLNGSSTSRSGTSVTYDLNIEESGLYEIRLKYKQNSIAGVGVGRNIYIDGVIPFNELKDYIFPYQKDWTNYTLNNNGKPYYVYLTKGNHTLTFEATCNHVVDILDKLYSVMDSINSIGITINTITGSSSSNDITWKITKYLPNLANELQEYSSILMDCYNYINSLNPTSKEASEVSTLKIASKTLERLSKSPNKIQNRLDEFCNGSGSCYQLVGSSIGYLVSQPLDIDYIAISSSNYKMKSPNGNFFGRMWFSIKSFFYSFFDKRYNISLSNNDNTIDVMVASSNLYTNIIQEMADDDFTKKTGIKVNLNILSNTQSIILNNATNTNPDAVLEIDSWLPYTYALRGMLEDLSKYENFDEVTKDIYSSNFTPLIYENGVYAIPETQGMQLLFYRKDILNSIGLSAPSTWEDVIKMLPTLQSYQMNFFHPLGADSAYKGFSLTTPFLYMYGSEVYSEEGFTTCIGNENAIEAIKFMTDLFTIYNLPQQVSSFFENFRSGTLPVGVGGVDLYLQLKYACPELSGQWGILPVPGMENEEGIVERWTSTYGKCSMIFAKSDKKDLAWSFLKWWHSTDVMSEYVRKIKTLLGEKYLIIPANSTSLSNSPWDDEIKQQVLIQSSFSRIPAIIPGSYIVEREISNIWNNIVINKMIPRVAINASIPKINRELARKFEEFKYLENGKVLKNYKVPTNNNIHDWVKGKEYYEEK